MGLLGKIFTGVMILAAIPAACIGFNATGIPYIRNSSAQRDYIRFYEDHVFGGKQLTFIRNWRDDGGVIKDTFERKGGIFNQWDFKAEDVGADGVVDKLTCPDLEFLGGQELDRRKNYRAFKEEFDRADQEIREIKEEYRERISACEKARQRLIQEDSAEAESDSD